VELILQPSLPSIVHILDVPVSKVTVSETWQLVHRFMKEPRLHQIATVNPEFVMKAQSDAEFAHILREAELCIPDGIGLIYASRWLQDPLPERVAGSELVYHVAELAAQEGWRLFLLGAAPGVAEQAAQVFQTRYSALIIADTYAGSPALAENEDIVARINASGADILFVAYGAPNQDKWIARNREKMPLIRIAIGVGGSLDFVSGSAVRAPQWVQQLGLEWLHRLLHEPWRWRRMMALPHFAVKVLASRRR
jgi:N-acetylglucosaminyldiphosphoundecaprenol N-acetyl-beta-D-mannosaminyltransferase